MRIKPRLLLFPLAAAFALQGCQATTKIGTACKTTKDCNVAGQVCVGGTTDAAKICTHSCQGEFGSGGCPVGYNCAVVDAALGATCNKVPYAVDAMTGAPVLFGKSCNTS